MVGLDKTMSVYCVVLLCLTWRSNEAAVVNDQENVAVAVSTVHTECFGDLGCLDFKPNPNAESREPMKEFVLHTRRNPENDEGQILELNSNESITNSYYQPNKPTKVLIHGWKSDSDDMRIWMPAMRDELLKNNDLNVIFVNWHSSTPYPFAYIDLRQVALETGDLLNKIGDLVGIDLDNVHLIGHSLGAHTVGFVGKHLKGQVGRITGLDPAGPGFYNAPPKERLDYTDGKFVDVLHTGGTSSIMGLGMRKAIGHIDFYPNGGRKQPGCDKDGGMIYDKEYLFCNHIRSLFLYIESINSKCSFVAHKCDTYDEFQRGNCYSNNATDINVMGYYVSEPTHPPGTKYFLNTRSTSPYCGLQYKVTFNSARPLGFALNSPHGGVETKETSLVIVQPFDQGKKTKFYEDNNNTLLQ